MITVERSALVGYSAAQMFALVDDIESYPLFLPWCQGTEVEYRDAGRTVGTVHIGYRGVRQQFTTDNVKRPAEAIGMTLVRGPFKALAGGWQFDALAGQACRIELYLQYQFANPLLERLVGPVFNHISNTLVDAFVRRADSLHGAER